MWNRQWCCWARGYARHASEFPQECPDYAVIADHEKRHGRRGAGPLAQRQVE